MIIAVLRRTRCTTQEIKNTIATPLNNDSVSDMISAYSHRSTFVSNNETTNDDSNSHHKTLYTLMKRREELTSSSSSTRQQQYGMIPKHNECDHSGDIATTHYQNISLSSSSDQYGSIPSEQQQKGQYAPMPSGGTSIPNKSVYVSSQGNGVFY